MNKLCYLTVNTVWCHTKHSAKQKLQILLALPKHVKRLQQNRQVHVQITLSLTTCK